MSAISWTCVILVLASWGAQYLEFKKGERQGWSRGWDAGWKAAIEDFKRQALAQGIFITVVPPAQPKEPEARRPN